MSEQLLKEIADCVVSGKNKRMEELVPKALAEGLAPETVLMQGLVKGMEVVSNKFKGEEFYIPQVLLSERALNAGLKFITEKLAQRGFKPRGTLIIGTVKEDLHDIGKNLVAAMFRGQGFNVIDMAVDVKPELFLQAAKDHKADIVGMSALLTTTMDNMRTTVNVLKQGGFQGRIIVGGAPVTQGFADQIGADLFAEDAATAVDKVKTALGIR